MTRLIAVLLLGLCAATSARAEEEILIVDEGLTDLQAVAPKTLPPVDLSRFGRPSAALIAEGKALFVTNCAGCHGESGKGDGPAGAALNPRPRNFTSLQGWTNGHDFLQIYGTLEAGISKNGMPQFDYLSVEERLKMIHFVQSLNSGMAKPSDADLKDLDRKYGLSKQRDIPGQIPVSAAIELMAIDAPEVPKAKDAKPASEAAAPAPESAPAEPSAAAPAEKGGKGLVAKYACATCHRFDTSERIVGPSLFDVGKRLDKAGIRESILKPDAKIADGFQAGMMEPTLRGMGFYDKVTPGELKQMVDYLASLKGR